MPARRRTLRAAGLPPAITAPARLRVGVIGAGRVGAVLGAALAAAGHDVVAAAGLSEVRMLLQVHDELVFEVPAGREEQAAEVVRQVMARAAEPALTLSVPLDVEVGWGAHWGAAH